MSDKMKLIMESWRSFSKKTLNEVNLLDLEREADAPAYAKKYKESLPLPDQDSLVDLDEKITSLKGGHSVQGMSTPAIGDITKEEIEVLNDLEDRLLASAEGRAGERMRSGEYGSGNESEPVRPLSQKEVDSLNATKDRAQFIKLAQQIVGTGGFDLSAIDRDKDGAISAQQLKNIANAIA
jgi:hypothetical protein